MNQADDIARSREFLRHGVGTTTRENRVLPSARALPPIPARVGTAGPREEPGTYVEVDYAQRVLETDNSITYQYDMLNTPLDGYRLYLQPRPRNTTGGDDNYYASATKLTTTDGLLKTDYNLTLKTAMIRPTSGADRVAGFGASPVTSWFTDFDLIRGPTGVHAMVKKARKIDMLVDGVAETLELKPPPYTTPAGNGLCVLDEILKLGDPWHGLIQGGTLRLPGGKTRPVARPGIGSGVVYPLIPYGVTPASTADAADVAAGRTWLNYGLLAGECLYEQTIRSAFFAWVYIAPDNTTWRVEYVYVLVESNWNIQLKFYPLRKLFLTNDKWGGLVQTLLAPINPGTTAYRSGVLYDLDSKGANAVFFTASGSTRGAALVNIQGIPPAATATQTLLCDGSPYGSAYSMSEYQDVTVTETLLWQYRVRTIHWDIVENGTPLSTYSDATLFMQNIANGDLPPTHPDVLPPLEHDFDDYPIGMEYSYGQLRYDFNAYRDYWEIVGFCFDSSDTIREVKLQSNLQTKYHALPYPEFFWGNFDFLSNLKAYGDGAIYNHVLRIGDIVGRLVEGNYDGFDLETLVYEKYGPGQPLLPSDYSPVEFNAIRYSNRAYGLRVKIPGQVDFYHIAPMSPHGQSEYPADIVSQGQPFATYHPITHQIVWETGFVNFV
jgi:hypothetical protein